LSHLAQALAIKLLQLQFILKRRRVAKIDAVKQRLFRQGKIISLPWFKPEIEPVADMRVFDGDSAPDQVAADAYGGAEGEHRAVGLGSQ
jgi:hypothetical protein